MKCPLKRKQNDGVMINRLSLVLIKDTSIVISLSSYLNCGTQTLAIVDALPKKDIIRRRDHLDLKTVFLGLLTIRNELATSNFNNIPINMTSTR